MRKRFLEMWREDRGGALALVGFSIVLLVSMAAFGTDLAWFYLNSSRIQRAADASALAGVIWMPGDSTEAFATAQRTALRNGYDTSVDEVTVTPATVAGEVNQLQVTIRANVPTFFLKVIGFDNVDIVESAVAEYIPPLRLGSPENQFGNECDQDSAPPGVDCGDDFWANMHGPWTESRMGDAFGPRCQSGNGPAGGDNLGCTPNSDLYRAEGYLYGIESDSAFTVQFIDLAFHNTSGTPQVITSDQHRTGDRGCEDWGPSAAPECGPTMVVNLYAPDPDPLDLGAPICTAVVGPEAQVDAGAPYTWSTPDGDSCWTQDGPGIWVVQVQHLDQGAVVDRSGLNRYSIRTTTGQIFALRDFSIYNNASEGTTDFYLSEVPDFYAGKTLVIELFDPGEFTHTNAGAIGILQVMAPNGATWSVWTGGDCRIYERDNVTQPWSLQTTVGPGVNCQQTTTQQEFHNRWLKFEIDLPSDYSCDQDADECWWKINYDYPSGSEVQDTTTWRAFIIGNPIHLVS